MAKTVSFRSITTEIEKILEEYQKDVTTEIETGLDAAQKVLIEELKKASPGKGDYKDHWKAGESGKGYRRVINDKMVEWKGKPNSLAGILEYSTKHSKPHIESTKRKTKPRILKILKESITKGA